MVSDYLTDISFLRVAGLLIGIVVIISLFYRLRTYKSKRSNIWLLFYLSLTLVTISIFPGALDFPSQLLSLYDTRGGRIVTYIFLISCIFWVLLLVEREKSVKRDKNFDLLHNKLIINNVSACYHFEDLSYDIVVVIPAYNEEKNLAKVLDEIPRTIDEIAIGVVIVDDGSQDDTIQIARGRTNVILVSHLINRGGGAALKLGYKVANKLNAKIVVTMDADGQHQPKEISTLVKPIINNEADIIIGSRFLVGEYSGSFIRVIGIKIFNNIIKQLLGVKITDCTSGYRAFNFEKLNKITLMQNQYHTSELLIDAIKRGFVVSEVPVEIIQRFSGDSKKGSNFYYGFSFLKTIILTWLR